MLADTRSTAQRLNVAPGTRDAKAAIDPVQAVNNKYDDMAAAAKRAAAGNEALSKSLKGTLIEIERNRKAELDRLKASRRDRPGREDILAYPRLTLCISCRREYVPHLLSKGAESLATQVEVRGFETDEEMERAARIYMDRRGIVRPATPRLNPEFANPLFLRATCLALELEGRSEFPRGIRGTSEVLAFFLDSAARYLGTDHDGSDELIMPTRRALLDIASEMAASGRDFVGFGEAQCRDRRVSPVLSPGRAPSRESKLRGVLSCTAVFARLCRRCGIGRRTIELQKGEQVARSLLPSYPKGRPVPLQAGIRRPTFS